MNIVFLQPCGEGAEAPIDEERRSVLLLARTCVKGAFHSAGRCDTWTLLCQISLCPDTISM